jgi:DNA-binding transcriptional ArsR family regulator
MVNITKRIVEAGGFRSRPRSCAEVVTRRRAKRSAVWRLRCCISLIIQSQPAGASVRVADRVRQAEKFALARSTLSGHFSILKNAGLIVSEKNGTSIVYSLNVSVVEQTMAAMMDLLDVGKNSKRGKP